MKKQIVRIIIWLLILTTSITLADGWRVLNVASSTVRAVGDLTVDWGVPEGDPIFDVTGMVAGDVETRDVDVTNNASSLRPVGVMGELSSDPGNLASVLDIVISENGTDLYGGGSGTGAKTLSDFFTDSAGISGLHLLDLAGGDTANLHFQLTLDPLAGAEFEDQTIVFDLIIGISVEVPAECDNIYFNGSPIFGTEDDDYIKGTNGNDLIFGFEGDDKINSSNGDDCVVAGPGDDKTDNSNGNDVTFGNEGEDKINGSNGSDHIIGGPDNDTINGSNGNDLVHGEEGEDYIKGGNGNDELFGGPDNDIIEGGNGSDHIEGEEGDDDMFGGNGSDNLIGGPDNDFANGNLGSDTCDAESEISC